MGAHARDDALLGDGVSRKGEGERGGQPRSPSADHSLHTKSAGHEPLQVLPIAPAGHQASTQHSRRDMVPA